MSASVGLDTGFAREFSYSANDFEQLRLLARQHTGIELGQSKRELVYSRLVRRVRALGLDGFGAYADILQAGDSTEVERFANAITTNHTAFFREPHHFTFLREWLAQRRGRSTASIWSAGCSSGEEPYSIAMLAEMRPPASPAYHIVASDLNSTILARAVAGTYSIDRLGTVDANLQRRFFLRGIGANLGAARVKNTL
ncbi:MAG: chemotaxis protein CheR, partial [Gammaproteobacteria bacterium]|nr:chemotaxis protein CheR [Gammaproteobacteria bacterium]